MAHTRSRVIAVISAAVAATLLVSGCSMSHESEASSAQARSFPGVYAQDIAWGPCENDFTPNEKAQDALNTAGVSIDQYQCAMVETPLDWNDPANHETIELAVSKLPAASGAPLGSLFLNPGGPGASGVELAYRFAGMVGTEDVRDSYDVIGIDPRGIGLSSPIDCRPMSNVQEIVLAVCADEFPLVRSMGTSQVARDMDLVRTLEGDTKLNYLGYSYGTVLGATYATLFPDTVGRMVLDSSIDEQWATPLGRYRQLLASTTEMELLLEGCGTEYTVASCPVHSLGELFGETDAETADAADAAEVADGDSTLEMFASDGTEIGPFDIYAYLQSHLYGMPEKRITALNTIAGAFTGTQSDIDAIADTSASGGARVSMSGQIVTCHSQPHDPNVLGLLEAVDESGVPEVAGGEENAEEFLASFVNLPCAALAETGTDLMGFGGPVDTPILIVGITGDHATPYESGARLSEKLANTRFVTLDGHGHGASFASRSNCVDSITTAFLLEGALPETGTVCQTN